MADNTTANQTPVQNKAATGDSRKKALKTIFNFVASAGAGAVASYAIKTTAFTLIGSQALAIGTAVFAIGAFSAAFQRARDVHAWNKAHKDDKAGFFDVAKTGHSGKHYLKKGALSAAFALVGTLIGVGVSNWLHPDAATAVAVEPAAGEPPVATDPGPMIHPEPPVIAAPVDPLTEARNLIPANGACADMNMVLGRLNSANELVRAQAIKDLGYFFANGFCGVQENDALANQLYELSLSVSHGQNIQAAHDLGYQLLHGFGADKDYARAYELLNKASAGGHPLSPPILDYMKVYKLAP